TPPTKLRIDTCNREQVAGYSERAGPRERRTLRLSPVTCHLQPKPCTRPRASLTQMEYRLLGRSGLKVSALSFGAATFGGGNEFFKAWGSTQVEEARRMVDLCIDAGVNLFD